MSDALSPCGPVRTLAAVVVFVVILVLVALGQRRGR